MNTPKVLPPLENLTPVKPLPSDSKLIGFTVVGFVVFSILAATLYGLKGLASMTLGEAAVYCGAIGICAVLLSMAVVQVAIPGAKVRVPRGITAIASFVAVGAIVSVLFPNFGLYEFVGRGVPCLRLACLCAISFGLLAGIPLKRGCVTDWRAGSWLIGCFAGFAGVAVLCLHCPVRNALHIIVWHLGAVIISALGGLGIGAFIHRKRAMMS